ncbi:type I-C CRISPR-associated protein Cas5c [Allokutzneria sp. A3M-2-11 16]|uniref:type I-C CRISPR-associated protein Cas5c n=1 Tax=Allokutzneria sp. A3M-2-11 16 TaxID=2962043 RepID=UPI0020B6C2BD|nr:type I-C CRISPR-associated protein Cas5c [Allokutzneria sp. A3M-2-11 16]MCP3798452.1 type I-C CRISPR-associated protein Cas5c [Allokutzneria sp. A3M-2-11 16]
MPVVLDVYGDYACFTRPESKAERISYPVMTPSAAVGVLESVFWKPEFDYLVRRIEVLCPISWFRIRRNETSTPPTLSTILKQGNTFHYDTAEDRDQRFTLGLRDVGYRIRADMQLRPHATASLGKYLAQFQKRIDRGACFSHPYLGCREFSARDFGPPDLTQPSVHGDEELEELGVMFLRMDRSTGAPRSLWFTAQLHSGVLHVPTQGIHDPARDALTNRVGNESVADAVLRD